MAKKKKHHQKERHHPVESPELPLGPSGLRSTVRERWLGFATSLFVLFVYLRTLHPTIAGGDSGELITVSHTLGVMHPPGYPIYTMLGKLFTFIPFGSVAWRVNLLSAICNAVAAGFIFAATRRLSRDVWAGVVAGGMFAFAPLVWSYATVAEVFGLNNAVLSVLVYLTVRYWQERELRVARLGALFVGIGVAHHHTSIFYSIPLAGWILWIGRRDLFNPREILRLVGIALVPLLSYLYLPLADQRAPLVSWGYASSWDGFWTHFFRKEYGTFRLGTEANFGKQSQLVQGVTLFMKQLPIETAYVGFLVGIGGLWVSIKREGRRGFVFFSLFLGAGFIALFSYLSNLSMDNPLFRAISMRFWQQPLILVFIWIGLGFSAAISLFERQSASAVVEASGVEGSAPSAGLPDWVRPAVAIVAVLCQVAINFRSQDYSTDWEIHSYGKAIIGHLPENSLLLSKGDLQTNSIRYLQHCENFRSDVRVLDREMLTTPWMHRMVAAGYPEVVMPGKMYHPGHPNGFSWKVFLDANSPKFKIFMSNFDYYELDRTFAGDYDFLPYGIVNWLFPRREKFEIEKYITLSDRSLEVFTPELVKALQKYPDGTWEILTIRDFWESMYRRAYFLTDWGLKNSDNRAALERAVSLFEELGSKNPAQPPWFYKNLGVAYSHLVRFQGGPGSKAEEGMVKNWRRYLEFGPNEADTGAIRAQVATFNGKYL